MKIASRPPLRRLLALDRLIRTGDYPNARSVARELEVHPRTVHRDLDFLRDFWGAPVEFCHKRNGFYYREPDYALPLLRLAQGELISLFLAEQLLQQYHGTPYAKHLATMFEKLTAALSEDVTIDLSHLGEHYSFRQHGADAGDAKRFGRLAHAVRERCQLELVYWTASRDETNRRVVDPYHLTSIDGDWFLIAYCHLREAIRMFAPGRIRSLQETGVRFERPPDFRIQEFLDGGFRSMRGDGRPRQVRLHFTPEAARYVRERIWHPTQRLREQKDGSLILTLKVSHLLEVKRWVLSYGTGCRILEPEELRQQVFLELQRTLKQYEGMATPFPEFPEDI